jgi:hypothetical protein
MDRIQPEERPKKRSKPMQAAARARSTYPQAVRLGPGAAASSRGWRPPAVTRTMASRRRPRDQMRLPRLSARYQSVASMARPSA